MTRIKTITERDCEKRLEALWNKWRSLQRSKARETDSSEGRKKFADDLDKLWDIGSSDAIAEIRERRLRSVKDKGEDIRSATGYYERE